MGILPRWFARRKRSPLLRAKIDNHRPFVKLCLVGRDRDGVPHRTNSCDALIDTGSQSTIVPQSMLEEAIRAGMLTTPIAGPHGVKQLLRRTRVVTVSGEVMPVDEFVCRVGLAGGKGGPDHMSVAPVHLQVRSREHEAMERDKQDHEHKKDPEYVILGTRLMQHFESLFVWDRGRATLELREFQSQE